jgi:hypothetical protein
MFSTAMLSISIRGVSKKLGEWYQKANKTDDTNKLTLLAFKIIAILHNTLLATFIKLMETVSKDLFRNRSQNRCHTFLDCCHVCQTSAFHDALQEGKQKDVHRTPLIWLFKCGAPRVSNFVQRGHYEREGVTVYNSGVVDE